MLTQSFSHVRHWVFDLDNTLYPAEARLFDQIEVLMTQYVMQALGVGHQEADHLRHHYWQTHGTTLAGLMQEHDLSGLNADPDLRQIIADLPGQKVVYTNGSRTHAERVIAARGLSGIFDQMFGIEDAAYVPKPQAQAFETIFTAASINRQEAAMFEDDPRNLAVPHEMGLVTVLIGTSETQPHIHHQTGDLTGFLSQVT